MIKARAGSIIVLGLQAENYRELAKDRPILVKGEDIGVHGLKIVIFHYTTVEDATEKMKTLGFETPPTKTDPSGN